VGERARVNDAVRAAGGLLADADPAGVNLAAPAIDGDEIDVPLVGERLPTRVRTRTTRARRTARARSLPLPAASIDPNLADAATLARVPGFGVALAARIVTYRRVNGAFASLDELLDVAGMTPAKLDRAQPYLQLASGG
jgi:competence protein ComEA